MKRCIFIRTWYEGSSIHEKYITREKNITLDDSPETKKFVFPHYLSNLLTGMEYFQILYSMHVCVLCLCV